MNWLFWKMPQKKINSALQSCLVTLKTRGSDDRAFRSLGMFSKTIRWSKAVSGSFYAIVLLWLWPFLPGWRSPALVTTKALPCLLHWPWDSNLTQGFVSSSLAHTPVLPQVGLPFMMWSALRPSSSRMIFPMGCTEWRQAALRWVGPTCVPSRGLALSCKHFRGSSSYLHVMTRSRDC